MLKFLPLTEEAFGLDINDLSVKVVMLRKRSKGFALVSYNDVKIPIGIIEEGVIKDEDALAKTIRLACSTAKGEKIKTKYAIVSLPEQKSFLQVIQMPKMSYEELETAVPIEAENYIPMPISDVYLDFQSISPIKNYFTNPEILIVAMPKKIIDSYVTCIKKAGLVPVVFEAESQAVSRALLQKESNPILSILIDFGETHTNFIIHSGHSVRFTSSIPISSKMLTQAISDSLSVSFAEAEKLKIENGLNGVDSNIAHIIKPILEDLISEVKRYIDFYQDHSSYEYMLADSKAEKILLCGGGSALKGLVDVMSEGLGVQVSLGDNLINLCIKKEKVIIKDNLPSFTTAVGLALRQINNGELYRL